MMHDGASSLVTIACSAYESHGQTKKMTQWCMVNVLSCLWHSAMHYSSVRLLLGDSVSHPHHAHYEQKSNNELSLLSSNTPCLEENLRHAQIEICIIQPQGIDHLLLDHPYTTSAEFLVSGSHTVQPIGINGIGDLIAPALAEAPKIEPDFWNRRVYSDHMNKHQECLELVDLEVENIDWAPKCAHLSTPVDTFRRLCCIFTGYVGLMKQVSTLSVQRI